MENIARAKVADWQWFISHDKPIPDCFNDTVGRAYAWGAALIWIVEEDIQPPAHTLARMIQAIEIGGADIAAADYLFDNPLMESDNSLGVCKDGAGRVTWCRTGCYLFKRECLDDLPRPWFTLRNRLIKPGIVTWDGGTPEMYGCDIPFTMDMFQLGMRTEVIDIMCDHLQVIEMGQKGSNHGYHIIEPIRETRKAQLPLEAQWHGPMEQTDRSKSARPATAQSDRSITGCSTGP
jgi:hypothetical protein